MRALDTPIAIFPFFDKPPFSQNKGHSGKVGTPHSPLFPDRLSKETLLIIFYNYIRKIGSNIAIDYVKRRKTTTESPNLGR